MVGQFNVNPTEDNKTSWINGSHQWAIEIYTDANHIYEVNQNFNRKFQILDTSLTAPTAKLTSLSADTNTGVKVNNDVNEGNSITIAVETLDIHNGQTIGWEIEHIDTNASDFIATSGTATVSSGYSIDADGVPKQLNSNKNKGTASFTIEITDDTVTEGSENFALKLKYPTSSSTYFVNTKDAIGEVKKSIRINDTSQDPEADISGAGTIDEGVETTYTLSTENFRNNETIYWRILNSSNNVATSDFDNATGTATVTVTGTNTAGNRTGTATITITATADATTEGPETFTLQLYRDSSYSTVVNTTPGTNTHSTKSITVNDTSLSAVQYGGFITSTFAATPLFPAQANEGTELRFVPQAWNLSSVDDTNIKVYWIILDSNDEPAIQGTVDVRPLGADRTTIPDFNTIKGETTFKRIGYVTAVGNYFNYQTASSGDFIIPYHKEKETQSFTAINDFFSDGNKKFKVAYFATTNDRDNLSNALFTTPEFTIIDTSKTKIAFNSEIGFGIDASSSSSLLNAGQSLDSPSIDEGKTYYFRVETSAPPGTNLYYRVENGSSNDFITVDAGTLQDKTIGSFSYPIRSNTSIFDELSGRVTTFDRDGGSTSQLIDGEECVRSIAYIYLHTNPDLATESDETFDLAVYLDEDYSKFDAYVSQTITLKDTSVNIPAPTISVSLEGSPSNLYPLGGNATNGYTLTIGDTAVAQITLKWQISGATKDSTYSIPSNTYYESNSILRLSEQTNWWASDGNESGKLKALARGSGSDTLTFRLDAKNTAGDGTTQTASDSVTLIISALEELQIRTFVAYESVYIWRYLRYSTSGKQRFGYSTFGPTAAGTPSYLSRELNTNSMTAQQREDWGTAVNQYMPSENGNPWTIQGEFGSVFTRRPPGASRIEDDASATPDLDIHYFGNYTGKAYQYFDNDTGGFDATKIINNYGNVPIPQKPGRSTTYFWGMRSNFNNNAYYGLCHQVDGQPIGVDNDSSRGYTVIVRPNGSADTFLSSAIGVHYWETTNGGYTYFGMDKPTQASTGAAIEIDNQTTRPNSDL